MGGVHMALLHLYQILNKILPCKQAGFTSDYSIIDHLQTIY